MKKLFAVLALVGVMTSCKDKKKADVKTDVPTTTDPTTTPTTNPTSSVKFEDPEIQKFADDYTAFVQSYKAGAMDPSKAQELQKTATEWSAKMQPLVMKLANNPGELKKWQEWAMNIAKEMMPATK